MSGPIVRKYGFPNHEQIFGKRPLEHGADADPNAEKPRKSDEKPSEKDREKPKS
jgi:hypothetical protein